MTTFDRAAIARAVHHAVTQTTGTDGTGMCALYARAGALVVNAVLRQQVYVVNAGRLHVATGDRNGGGMLYLEMDPAVTGYNGMEFHAWIVRRPAWAAPGQTIDGRAGRRVEVVDLAMRHFQAQAQAHGVPWRRAPLPAFYWGPMAGLSRLDVKLRADPKMTTMILEAQPHELVETTARRALGSL
jgi:hypothetical protein